MRDLFSTPERDLTLDHVLSFLAVDEATSLNERPKEGVRIDYKSKSPSDLAKIIVAFANTHGGIAFLGVREERGAPVEICGYPRARTDLKTAIANAIRTSVYPPYPACEVIVFAISDTHDIALVRVAEGDEAPYQHQNGVVYVRSQDRTNPARPQEIIALATTDTNAESEAVPLEMPHAVWIRRLSPEDGKPMRSTTSLKLCVRPTRRRHIRVDRRFELVISELLLKTFELPFVVETRQGPLIEWKHYDGPNDFDRRVAVVEDGRFCYIGQVLHEGRTLLVPLIDIAERFCAFATAILRATGHHGNIDFAIELATGASEIIGQKDGIGRELLGIYDLASTPNYPSTSVFSTTMDYLEQAHELIAVGLFEQLRSERGASIDFKTFSEAIRAKITGRRAL